MSNAKLKFYTNNVTATALAEDFNLSLSPNGNYVVLTGFFDVHVHLREPGFSYKEKILSGTKASARGGYTAVCSMPNLNPVPDSAQNLKIQTDLIKNSAVINVYPYGAITVGEKGETLADLEGMKDAIAFSDDGKGVQSNEMMLTAMKRAKALNKMIVAHCEVKLVKQTGVSYHVCHISTKESVDIIRTAKGEGVDITCETAPHYLVLTDADLKEDGKFKMNPPLRSEEDRLALIEGIKDGTIDMIATDHAPHSAEEKSKGLEKSAFGIVGIETAFSVCYTYLVKTNIISLEKLIDLLSTNPRKRFKVTGDEGFSVWNLDETFVVDPSKFISLGKATPFENYELYGVNYLTVLNGKAVDKK